MDVKVISKNARLEEIDGKKRGSRVGDEMQQERKKKKKEKKRKKEKETRRPSLKLGRPMCLEIKTNRALLLLFFYQMLKVASNISLDLKPILFCHSHVIYFSIFIFP